MTFYVKTLDNERHPFDLTHIHDGISKKELMIFIEKKLGLIFFDISYEEPIKDKSVINIINPCKEVDESIKEYYCGLIRYNEMEDDVYNYSAYVGHLECLKFAHENRHKDLPLDMSGCLQYFKKDKNWEVSACKFAARNGYLDCLKYLYENGCELDKRVCNFASYGGHLECLKYLIGIDCGWIKEECLELSKDHPHIQEYIKSLP